MRNEIGHEPIRWRGAQGDTVTEGVTNDSPDGALERTFAHWRRGEAETPNI